MFQKWTFVTSCRNSNNSQLKKNKSQPVLVNESFPQGAYCHPRQQREICCTNRRSSFSIHDKFPRKKRKKKNSPRVCEVQLNFIYERWIVGFFLAEWQTARTPTPNRSATPSSSETQAALLCARSRFFVQKRGSPGEFRGQDEGPGPKRHWPISR